MKNIAQMLSSVFLTFMTIVTMSCVMLFTTVASDDNIFCDDFTKSRIYTQQHESYSDSMAAASDAELHKGWLLWHSYSEYAAPDSKLYLRTPDGNIKEIGGDFIHAIASNSEAKLLSGIYVKDLIFLCEIVELDTQTSEGNNEPVS